MIETNLEYKFIDDYDNGITEIVREYGEKPSGWFHVVCPDGDTLHFSCWDTFKKYMNDRP